MATFWQRLQCVAPLAVHHDLPGGCVVRRTEFHQVSNLKTRIICVCSTRLRLSWTPPSLCRRPVHRATQYEPGQYRNNNNDDDNNYDNNNNNTMIDKKYSSYTDDDGYDDNNNNTIIDEKYSSYTDDGYDGVAAKRPITHTQKLKRGPFRDETDAQRRHRTLAAHLDAAHYFYIAKWAVKKLRP